MGFFKVYLKEQFFLVDVRITLEKHFVEFYNLPKEMGQVTVSDHSVGSPESDRLLVGDFFFLFSDQI